jgi:serine phosphatase RsbU (regulator of sigma subunit)
MNLNGQEFSAERLMEVVQRAGALPATEIVRAVFASVEEFRAGAPPNDDMTVVAVKIIT